MILKVVRLRAVETAQQRLVPAVLAPLVHANEQGLPLDPVVVETTKMFGFDSFSCLMADSPRPLERSALCAYTTNRPEWMSLYEREQFITVDPRLRIVQNTSMPAAWDQASERGRSPRADAFLDAAARFNIRSGIAIAQNNVRGHSVVVMFNSAQEGMDAARRAMLVRYLSDLCMFAQHFSELFLLQQRDVLQPARPELNEREATVLRMTGEGCTGAEIGRALGITERTVQANLDAARRKLGATNRQQAVAKAVKNGLIVVNG